MSSDYHALCMAHDPAIRLGDVWSSAGDALAGVRHRASEDLRGHATCDLLVGRYSYPLIEVCCPPTGETHPGWHRDEQWITASWLRLLYHAYRSKDGAVLNAAQNVPACWTALRVLRLRAELGIDTEETTP